MESQVFPTGLDHLDASKLSQGYVQKGDYAEFTREIIKSPNDECNYRLLRLNNGLEVMLVQDHKAEKSAASLSVRVGHLSDPTEPELPGLAHFLEHLLFMGSEKYPGENDYSAHLSNFTGSSNAYTSTDATVYFFNVAPQGFEGALDRFAQFFICPLFKEDCVEREIKAVNSEHMKNLQADGWRLMQLERSLSKHDHPYKKFGTGSLETLWTGPREKGVNVRDELIKFHERYYSANVMKLVLVTKDSLDHMASLAVNLFQHVTNKNLTPQVFPGNPYDPSLHMTRLSVKTVKDIRGLMVQFPFYDQSADLGFRPASYISHFIGHEGPTSLFTFLKKKGLVEGLGAGHSNPAPGIDFFNVNCSLTKEGLKDHQLIVSSIFEFIELLKSQPLPSWAFDEVKQLSARAFRFQEAGDSMDTAVDLSEIMQEPYPRNLLLAAPYTMTEFKPEEVKHALEYLSHQTCRVRVYSKEPLEGLTWDMKEKWYGTEYTITKLEDGFFKSEVSTPPKFSMPSPNPYIDADLDLIGRRDVKEPLKRPLCIKQTVGQRIWFKQDDRWKVPMATIRFKLSNPLIRHSYKNKMLCRFYTALVNDALEEETYDAGVAGLGYGLGRGSENLFLSVSGYNSKLPALLKIVLRKMATIQIDDQRFKLTKESFLQGLDNHVTQSPLQQCSSEAAWLSSQYGHTDDEEKKVLEAITSDDVQKFIPQLLAKFHMEALGHGNLHKSDMYECCNMVEEILGFERLSKEGLLVPCSRLLPEKCNYAIQLSASSKDEVNSGILYWMHIGHPSQEDLWTRLIMLSRLAREPCFDQLRTQEQLGYIVGSGIRSTTSSIGFQIQIQSERNPVHLENRINAFLDAFSKTLESLDEERLESVRSGLLSDLAEDFKNQHEETGLYWGEIASSSYDFFYNDRMIGLIKQLTKADIYDFYMKFIHHASETRSKLSLHVYSQRLQADDLKPALTALNAHGFASKDLEKVVAEKPRNEDFKKAVEELLKTKADLHDCCKTEIMEKVKETNNFPIIANELKGVTAIGSLALRRQMKLGGPRKPFAEYYDGVAKL